MSPPDSPNRHTILLNTLSTRTGRGKLSPVVQWIVDAMRRWLSLMLLLRVLTIGSVGLNVTSLKWTGPDSEDSEALPRIPPQIEYNDKVQRAADIELANEETPSLILSRNGTDTEIPAPFIINVDLAFW